jgi:hypothetical protein
MREICVYLIAFSATVSCHSETRKLGGENILYEDSTFKFLYKPAIVNNPNHLLILNKDNQDSFIVEQWEVGTDTFYPIDILKKTPTSSIYTAPYFYKNNNFILNLSRSSNRGGIYIFKDAPDSFDIVKNWSFTRSIIIEDKSELSLLHLSKGEEEVDDIVALHIYMRRYPIIPPPNSSPKIFQIECRREKLFSRILFEI